MARLAQAVGARAGIEAEAGRLDTAISFGRTALRYAYTVFGPLTIAVGHHNLAEDLGAANAGPAEQRAHRLAAALVFRLTGMAHYLDNAIGELARELAGDDGPVTLGQVVERVERTEGVRFGTLLATLATEEEAEEALAEIPRSASGGR